MIHLIYMCACIVRRPNCRIGVFFSLLNCNICWPKQCSNISISMSQFYSCLFIIIILFQLCCDRASGLCCDLLKSTYVIKWDKYVHLWMCELFFFVFFLLSSWPNNRTIADVTSKEPQHYLFTFTEWTHFVLINWLTWKKKSISKKKKKHPKHPLASREEHLIKYYKKIRLILRECCFKLHLFIKYILKLGLQGCCFLFKIYFHSILITPIFCLV